MKNLFIYTAILCSTICATAQNVEKNDTILSIKNTKNIVITENKNGLKVSVNGTDEDSTYVSTYEEKYTDDAVFKSKQVFNSPWERKATGKIALTFGGLAFGFVTAPGMPGSMDVEPVKSYELSILNILGVEFRDKSLKNSLSMGFGVNWKNIRTTKNTRFVPTDDNGIAIAEYPENCKPKFSRLKEFSLSFPIMYRHSFSKNRHGVSKFAISAGAILNYNSHASLVSSWLNEDGNEVEESTNHIGQRKFTVDLMGVITVAPNVGVYAKYCPMNMLKDNYGPGFKTFSTGLIFAF